MNVPTLQEIDEMLLTEKVQITTNIPIGLKVFCERMNIPINEIVEVGFRNFFISHSIKNKIEEIENAC